MSTLVVEGVSCAWEVVVWVDVCGVGGGIAAVEAFVVVVEFAAIAGGVTGGPGKRARESN